MYEIPVRIPCSAPNALDAFEPNPKPICLGEFPSYPGEDRRLGVGY